jgi:probable F420-dependent oxidoreductase
MESVTIIPTTTVTPLDSAPRAPSRAPRTDRGCQRVWHLSHQRRGGIAQQWIDHIVLVAGRAEVKFGVSYNTGYYGVDPDKMVALAKHAEDCGFESLYASEHIVLYPGAMAGPFEFPTSLPIADPLECLSFVAAATKRILLGTGVLLLPYHHPVVLAKRLATIDVLSKGRMRLLTVGLGTLPGEAGAIGVDFATRGRRADEAIDVLRMLWAGGESGVSFDGEFFSFKNICSFPKPYDTETLPIHVGGSSQAAARRAGRRGNGYFPGGRLTAQERANQIDTMRQTARDEGRDAGALEYTRWGTIDMSEADVEGFADKGVTRLIVGPSSLDLDEQRDQLSAFADRLRLSGVSHPPG